MRIAITLTAQGRISGHAGKARHWLVHEADGAESSLELSREQLFHYWDGAPGTHPLEKMDVVVAGSAGDGFVRRLARSGIQVLTTSETDPHRAIACLEAGKALPEAHFNPLLLVCKVRDLFSKH